MYDELVKRLRRCASDTVEDCDGCPHQGGYKGTYCMNGLIEEAADAIEQLQLYADLYKDLTEKGEKVAREVIDKYPKWIPVTERLPEDDTICILTNGVSDAIGYRGKVFGWHLIWTDYLEESEVSHWMPLPEPPKEEDEEK